MLPEVANYRKSNCSTSTTVGFHYLRRTVSACSIVAELGSALMPAAPEGPTENILFTRHARQQQTLNQVTDFRNRQWNELPIFFGAVGFAACARTTASAAWASSESVM